MSRTIYSVDDEEQKRQAEHKLRPRPIDIAQKLEVLFHTLEEVEEEKNAIFFSDYAKLQYSDEPEPLKDAAVPIPRIIILKDDGVSKKLKPFTRPKNYIEYKARPDAEVGKSTEYEVDDEDEEFIEALNKNSKKKEQSSLTVDKLENIIDFLEKDLYYKKKLFFIDDKPSIYMDPKEVTCMICSSSKASNENSILVCTGCGSTVHQKCYGIKKEPKEWKCSRCTQQKNKISCELCPVTEGVFASCGNNQWVHLACALSFNEIPMPSTPNGYTIQSIDKLPLGSRSSTCYLCDIRKGACVKCFDTNCEHYLHITCGIKRGLNTFYDETIKSGHKTKSKSHGDPAPVLRSYCVKHSINAQMLKNRNHLFVHKEFTQEEIDEVVRLASSSSRKINLDRDTMEMCYRYWMSRRMFNGKPLITRLQDIVKDEKEARRRSCKLVVDEEKFKKMKMIRQSLERTRLLIDLSRKRELVKRQMAHQYKDIVECMIKEHAADGNSKKSPKKQQSPSKKALPVKIKKEPNTSDNEEDEMSVEKNKKQSPKASPKKKINGHAHKKAVTPVIKAVNGRPAPSKKEEANGKKTPPPNKKSTPASKKNEPNGTSKQSTNKKKPPPVIEIASESSESEESEKSAENDESASESSEDTKKSAAESDDEDSSEKSDKLEASSKSDEESSDNEEKSSAASASASESDKDEKSDDKSESANESASSSEDKASESGSGLRSEEEDGDEPMAEVKEVKANTNKKKQPAKAISRTIITKATPAVKRPNNRGDRHTKPPPPTRGRPNPVLVLPIKKKSLPVSKKRKRNSTSFTSNKKRKLRR